MKLTRSTGGNCKMIEATSCGGVVIYRGKILALYKSYKNRYEGWVLPKGTVEQGETHIQTAFREVREEAGIAHVYPVLEEIFSLESLTVDGHIKKGKYVSSHLHLNITYLLEADPEEHLSIKEDENSGVAWFTPEEALEKSTEPWFVERVYKKLIKKTNLLNGVRVNENEVSTE